MDPTQEDTGAEAGVWGEITAPTATPCGTEFADRALSDPARTPPPDSGPRAEEPRDSTSDLCPSDSETPSHGQEPVEQQQQHRAGDPEPPGYSDRADGLPPHLLSSSGLKWSTDIPEDGSVGPGLGDPPLGAETWGRGPEDGAAGKGSGPEAAAFLDGERTREDPDAVPIPAAGRLTADSAAQTECETAEAEVNTDQDIGNFMKAVTCEREVLKERYQEVLDRHRQLENQLQIKIRCLQQQAEEEKNICQENGKQIQEVKTKLEELKKKSEREKKEYLQKEQEMKSEIEKLYETGKQLMKEQEEKGIQVAILISEQAEKKEKVNGDLARARQHHNEVNKKILAETERALKAEVISLESKRQLAVMMLDQAEMEAEMQIRNSGSLPINSGHLQEWQVRLSDIRIQKESLKKQYSAQIEMVKNGAKLSSLSIIPPPNLLPAPAEVTADAMLKGRWPGSIPLNAFQTLSVAPVTPHFPTPFFPSSSGSTPPSLPGAFYRRNLPGAPPGLGGYSEAEGMGCPPAPRTVAKLDKLLEKLQAKLPHCSRAQLTQQIKQIKMSRGSIADLSVDELMNLVAQRLNEAEQSPGSPRLCLMCQKVVRGNEVHPMSCSHIVHKECIKYWAQSNKNSACPFCPTLR
ncbi:RING finger protein 214 [Callorhinchus milii]|uniref:RING finger protein 214 n=1 Tax=Callorhinchus milii TaxID=7868 RepID=UPI001C3F7CFB|nr:RING finger protein 214 [Callorhinchus milii]